MGSSGAKREIIVNFETLEQYKNYKFGDGSTLLNKIVSSYQKKYPVCFEKMTVAIKNGDAAALLFVAHSMKSSSGMLGLEKLQHVFENIEEHSKDFAEKKDPFVL